jgi:hypothetical protein
VFLTRLMAVAVLTAGPAVLAGAPALAAPPPIVTSVTPAADTTGSQVVVSGSNLTLPPHTLADKIFFGTAEAKINNCAPLTGAASSCNVTVPPQCAGQKVVDVRVVVGTLESAVSSDDKFTYTDAGTGPSSTACASPTSTATATATSTATGTPAATGTPSATPSATSASAPPAAVIPSGGAGTGAGGTAGTGSTPLIIISVLAVLGAAAGSLALRLRRRQR